MASLRQQAKDYDAVFAKTAKKAKRAGAQAGIDFKGSGRSAAYRGAATKVMRTSGSSEAAHKAGLAAEKRVATQRQRMADIDAQFKNRRGKKAEAERAAARKEASQGGSPLSS